MQHRTLGKTGWKVSAIGFGAWGIGGQWGPVQDAAALDAVKAAYEVGVNFFDVADAYGEPPGRSEELLGRAIKELGCRGKVFIATKVGNFARRQGHPLPYNDPLHVELCCDASLHRMRLETIDLYQCHLGRPKPEEIDVFLTAFDTLLKKGSIRAYGISTDSVEALAAFDRDGAAGGCATVQLDYSFLNRAAEKELLPYCQKHNLGTVIRGPLNKGLCTGKFRRDSVFEDWVRQGWNQGEGRDKFLRNVARVEAVRFLERPGRTLAQAALQFVVAHPAVSVAIPGAKDAGQARANAAAGDAVLSPEELEQVRAVTGV